jgi:glycosyltransferase involved in cell wall biosynthesis
MEDRDRPPILFFGNDWAAENRTSSHQIARWLARGREVYYIECPGLRAPKTSGRDLRKIWSKVVRFFRGPRAVPEGLRVWTLLQIPLHRFRLVRWFNRLLMLVALRRLIRSRWLGRPVAWFMLPHLASLVGRLGESLSVYYCIDDYSALPDVNEAAVRAMDEETTRKAELVFVASATLLEAKLRENPNTHVSPHGVDLDHFARARDDRTVVPPDVRDLTGPVVGFFGLIEKWIDLELIDYLAEKRPDCTFVLIGRVAVPREHVPNRPNVRLLGVRPYEQLPEYGKRFDVAIIPYHLTRQVINANPIKLREYLAMGKPVVSVSTPEIDKYADVVRIARTREEFLAQLDAAVAEGARPAEVERRVARVVSEGWDARLRRVLNLVDGQATAPRGAEDVPGWPSQETYQHEEYRLPAPR